MTTVSRQQSNDGQESLNCGSSNNEHGGLRKDGMRIQTRHMNRLNNWPHHVPRMVYDNGMVVLKRLEPEPIQWDYDFNSERQRYHSIRQIEMERKIKSQCILWGAIIYDAVVRFMLYACIKMTSNKSKTKSLTPSSTVDIDKQTHKLDHLESQWLLGNDEQHTASP